MLAIWVKNDNRKDELFEVDLASSSVTVSGNSLP